MCGSAVVLLKEITDIVTVKCRVDNIELIRTDRIVIIVQVVMSNHIFVLPAKMLMT